jgi:hypothetical protein
MATPKCPAAGCNGTTFELKEVQIGGTAFRVATVHCSRCGAVVGVLPGVSTAALLQQLETRLDKRLSDVDSRIGVIDNHVRRLVNKTGA